MILLIFQCWAGGTETNQVRNASSTRAFDDFKIIAQRNIFNPNRSARGSRAENGEAPKVAKSESFALVGTMLYDDRQFAFFDSSSSSYKKVLKIGDTIAGYKINQIAPNGVKLETDGKVLEVAVGQQLRREDEGEWIVSGKAAAESPGSSDKNTSSRDDEDEAVKRLMKKREEEMNK
jgi:hypothetical protein